MDENEKRAEKRINYYGTRIVFAIVFSMIAFLYLAFNCINDGLEKREEYYEYIDKVIAITARITDVHESEKYSVPNHIYVSYEYNGETFVNVFWKETTDFPEVGKTVEIKISPEDPEYVFSEDNGTKDFILAIFLSVLSLSTLIAMTVRYIKIKRKSV